MTITMVGRVRLLAALVTACGLVAACGKDTTGTIDSPPPGGFPIPTLGSGLVADRYTAEVAVSGNVAYTTTWGVQAQPGNTTYVWNISGATPVMVDSLQVSDVTTMGDVQISPDGKYLVVATERTNGSILVYDRSTDPLHPTLVSRFLNAHTTAGVHTMKMSVVNGRLYGFLQIDPGTEKARETIVDMTDPTRIAEVYSAIMGRPYVHDVYVRDGYLFAAVWNDGMSIYDIGGGGAGSPASPAFVSTVKTETGQIHNIWWYHDGATGAKKYAFLGEEGPGSVGSFSSGDIHIVDVSNLSAPHEVAKFNVAGAGTHNFWVDEKSGVLYAAYYNGGVRAIDVRGDLGTCTSSQKGADGLCDLEKMGRLVGQGLADGSYYIWGVAGSGNRLFASDMNSGLIALDISRFKR